VKKDYAVSDIKWQRKDNWVGSQVDEAFVMLDFVGGEYISLNSTAAKIWDTLEQPRSAQEIVSALTETFDVSGDQAGTAVSRVLGLFEGKGLIQQVG
jgi:hypothetical protein